MEPTIYTGRKIFVNKFIYRFLKPERGDIIVFKDPVDGKGEVKRVIAIPNDRIKIVNKVVYLNGQPLNEPYAVFLRKNEILQGDNIEELTVPPGHYFVMGDNRDYSKDSRDWMDSAGNKIYFLPEKLIEGKAIIW